MSTKKLVIVGAGNFGRELLCWAKDIPEDIRNWEVKGYLDDNKEALNGFNVEVPIISDISSYEPQADDVFICAVANPIIKLNVCGMLTRKGAEFINIIHPTCVIGDHNVFGRGVVMCPYSIVSSHVKIGNHVHINVHSSIGHDAVIEDGATLSGHCDITGFVRLDRGVFLGSGSRLLPRAHAEEFSIIGAGAVVLNKVEAYRTVVGVPARYVEK